MEQPTLEYIENRILRSAKFVDLLIQEIRKENKELQEALGISYAKYIGLGSPFERALHVLKDVKKDFNNYLEIVRNQLLDRNR